MIISDFFICQLICLNFSYTIILLILLIHYQRLGFQWYSNLSLLHFLLALGWCPKRIRHVVSIISATTNFKYLFKSLYKPDPFSCIICNCLLLLIVFLTVLSADKLFDSDLRIVKDHLAEEILLGVLIWHYFLDCLADSPTGTYGFSHVLVRTLVHDGLQLTMVGFILTLSIVIGKLFSSGCWVNFSWRLRLHMIRCSRTEIWSFFYVQGIL